MPQQTNIMPRLNDVFVSGFVQNIPSAKYEKGVCVGAAVEILVIHGRLNHDTGDIVNKGFDTIWISSKDKVIITRILDCKPFDLVQVKGVLRVSETRKRTVCPECKTEHIYRARKTAIYPLHFEVVDSIAQRHGIFEFKEIPSAVFAAMKDEVALALRERVEVSNNVKLIGVICRQPSLFERMPDHEKILSFPFAVKRKYYIAEDDMRVNVDFPFVKLYGKEALSQYEVLRQGNLCMIDGFIASRNITRVLECENCKSKFPVPDTVAEVQPYSIEYIRENISDVPTVKPREDGYAPKFIGSEADIDLITKMPQEVLDSTSASGYTPYDDTEQKIIDAVAKMSD